MTTLTIELPDAIIQKLQARADNQAIPLTDYIQSTLVDTVIDDDEPTDEEILATLKEAFLEAIRGDMGRPAHEVLDELDQEIEEYAD
jgi:predicted transcriptional regulator